MKRIILAILLAGLVSKCSHSQVMRSIQGTILKAETKPGSRLLYFTCLSPKGDTQHVKYDFFGLSKKKKKENWIGRKITIYSKYRIKFNDWQPAKIVFH